MYFEFDETTSSDFLAQESNSRSMYNFENIVMMSEASGNSTNNSTYRRAPKKAKLEGNGAIRYGTGTVYDSISKLKEYNADNKLMVQGTRTIEASIAYIPSDFNNANETAPDTQTLLLLQIDSV